MTKNMFTQGNLEDLKEAIVDVFNIFSEVLRKPCGNYDDLKERLEVVDAVRWEAIRAKYIDEDYTGYKDGEFTLKENLSVVKILCDFIKQMERASESVIYKLNDKCKEVHEMEEKVRWMEERVKKTDTVMHSQEEYYKQKCSDNSDLLAKITQLQATVDEKHRKIYELEKDKNVHVWESEKKRLLKEYTERIESLEAENEELKKGRDTIKRRLSNLEDSMKKMKLKQQLSDKMPSPEDNSNASDKLCRTNFIQDKDIVYLEKQLYDLQTCTVGVIGGMKTDFNLLSCKFLDLNDGEIDPDFRNLKHRMEKCYSTIAEGEITKAREDMPPHYRYLENDNFRVRRIRRLSAPAIVPNQNVLKGIIEEKKTASVAPTLSGISEDAPPNPVIVNPTTKRLHPINPLKYFGHMSQSFILDQYEKFTEFDKNGDQSLDLSEMVKVVTQLGFNFNAHQLQEAMEEVDRDKNHTLDFYEYLLIIDNIYTKSGKAEVFKVGMKELQKNNASKSCAIQ